MGKYTNKGSSLLENKISQDIQRIVTYLHQFSESQYIKSIVLMGGYGRGEGTPFIKNNQEHPFNDYDLIVVSENINAKQKRLLTNKLHEAEKTLTESLDFPVDLFLHTPQSLKNAECSLMNYELKYGHLVVDGDKNLLNELLPNFKLSEIPLSEGSRLLLNRGTLLLYNQRKIHSADNPEIFLKFIIKAHLALGDCLLLALNQYTIKYSEKKQLITKVSEVPNLNCFPWIKKYYLKSMEFKDWGDYQLYKEENIVELFVSTLSYFIEFFFWYEQRRLNAPVQNVSAYVEALSQREKSSPIKAFIFNLLFMKSFALSPSPGWCLIHPRYRLFPALILLLKNVTAPPELDLLQRLLGSRGAPPQLLQQFIQLRKRFS